MSDTSNKAKIVITGFGLFRDLKSNPSWDAVQLLVDSDEFELIKIEIPVAYDCVENEVKRIWREYNDAKLIIHCGVSCWADGLTLEKRAVLNMERYCQPDVKSCVPNFPRDQCATDLQFIVTELDLEYICNAINKEYKAGLISLGGDVSDRAGEYLCEYIYKCSLQYDPNRTLFIHVPQLTDQLSAQDISKALQVAVTSAFDLLKNKTKA